MGVQFGLWDLDELHGCAGCAVLRKWRNVWAEWCGLARAGGLCRLVNVGAKVYDEYGQGISFAVRFGHW